jgi:hypothetical protein
MHCACVDQGDGMVVINSHCLDSEICQIQNNGIVLNN